MGLPAAAMGTMMATPTLFSLELEQPSPFASAACSAALQAQLQLLRDSLEPLLKPASPWAEKLARDVLLFHDVLMAEEDEVDGVVLASKLTAAGYRVAVRQALGGGSGVAVFSNLRHSFLLITHDAPRGPLDYIVEPHFREQFEISHPTPRYSGLLAMLPQVLVAPPAQLAPLVQLLCAEMSLAFEQHGLSLPPWRESKSLLSKWLPSKARDLDLSPFASPRGPSPVQPFPLVCAVVAQAGAASRAVSEAASGSITPAGFSSDDASPRAVLHGASTALSAHQLQRGDASSTSGGGGGGPTLVRKSLLTSSLAPSRRSASPPAPRRAASLSAPGPRGDGLPAAQPQLVGEAAVVQHSRAALTYCVAPGWQQPAIRTVKMQGAALK